MNAGNMPAAKAMIDRIMRQEPDNHEAHVLLIDYELKLGNYKTMARLCRSSLSLWPDNADIRSRYILSRMRCWFTAFRLIEIHRLCKEFERDFPTRRMDLLTLKGIWAIAINNRWSARRIRNIIAEEYPDSTMTTTFDRMIAKLTDDLNLKESAAIDALGHNHNDASAYAELAFVQFDLCRFAAARRSAKAALALDPMNRKALMVLRLSWLVWFPPFLISNVFFAIPILLRRWISSRRDRFLVWVAIIFAAITEMPALIELAIIDSAPIASIIFWVGGYFCWAIIKSVGEVRFGRKSKVKALRLSKY